MFKEEPRLKNQGKYRVPRDKPNRLIPIVTLTGVVVLAVVVIPDKAKAIQLYNGAEAGNNVEVNLNITTSFSSFYRVNDPSAVLTNQNNYNDGDVNFRHGFVGNIFSVVPVLDIKDGDLGAHFSGQMFLNTSYLRNNQNNQPLTINQFDPAENDKFTSGTRNVNGEQAQLLDAFVYDSVHFGADGNQAFTLKIGQQTLLWGQSLFFTNNGIAAGQAPIDLITAQSLVNPQAQQVFFPVGQIVATYQPNDAFTLQAYYQYQWQPDQLQGAGAYFSYLDFAGPGSQRLIAVNPTATSPGIYLYQTKAQEPPPQNGQFGASIRATFGNYDVGLYALRFDAKAPEVVLQYGAPALAPGGISFGTYRLAYQRDIQLYGASLSTIVDNVNVAGEVSGRRGMNLVSPAAIATPANEGGTNNDPLYAVGDTLAAQASAIYTTQPIPGDPGGVQLLGEVELNHVLSVTANKDELYPGRSSTAAAFDVAIIPQYYDVLPSLELQFPISLLYDFAGNSEIDAGMNHGTGTFSAGVTAIYRGGWDASLAYVDYLGKPGPVDDPNVSQFSDRGYVTLNLQHTF